MFQSAVLRLSGIYIVILCCITIFFSLNWYTVATRELDQGRMRQDRFLSDNPGLRRMALIEDLVTIRESQIEQSKQAIVQRIIAIDVFIITLGGIGSYIFAKRTLRPLKEAHESLERFTADASHELRTPIAIMQTEIEVALRQKKLSSTDARLLLVSTLEELTRLTRLSDGLLRLARKEPPATQRVVSVSTIVDQAIASMAAAAQHKSVTIVARVNPARVYCRPYQIQDLLVILLDNAIKYSPVDSTVTITGKSNTARTYIIRVKDTGLGIAKADHTRIFERFYRADAARSSQTVPGTGLGLAIAQHIAQENDTQIHVRSKPGKGAEFWFTIPIDMKQTKAEA